MEMQELESWLDSYHRYHDLPLPDTFDKKLASWSYHDVQVGLEIQEDKIDEVVRSFPWWQRYFLFYLVKPSLYVWYRLTRPWRLRNGRQRR